MSAAHQQDHRPAEPASAPDQAAQDAQYYRRVLHDLIDIGAELARLIRQQALEQAAAPQPDAAAATTADHAMAFDRVARAVRRTVMLARKLDEPVRAPAAPHPLADKPAGRKRIADAIEDAIGRSAKTGDEAERLRTELRERLDAPDLDDDIADRPAIDIIHDICRDLRLDPRTWPTTGGKIPWELRDPKKLTDIELQTCIADLKAWVARDARKAKASPDPAIATPPGHPRPGPEPPAPPDP